MVDSDAPKRVALILKRLRPGVADGRSPAPTRMVAALDKAEAGARLVAGAKQHLYMVNYRIGEVRSGSKGEAAKIRSELVGLLESRLPFEKHVSTSAWLFRSFLGAGDLAGLLSAPLDRSCDFLSVSVIGRDRATFGDADLQS